MKGTFTPQEQQQLNSTGMCDDSVVVRDSTIKESVANREEQQERRNKRILIVADEPDITFTLRTILEENGYKEVDVYNEPLLALHDFKSGVLLITDIAMPRMDGFELYKQIKNIDTKIRVIFTTASTINYEALSYLTLIPVDRFDTSEEKDKVAILRGSGKESEDRIHFIRKPVEIKEFIQRVTKELQQGRLGIEKTRCYKEIEFKQTSSNNTNKI